MDELELLDAVADAARGLENDLCLLSEDKRQALARLRVALHDLDLYRAGVRESEPVGNARHRPCEYCSVPIFFAKTVDGRWMPFELDQVSGEHVPPSYRYVIDFNRAAGPWGAPEVRFAATHTGPVWVCHMQTCGAKAGPKVRAAPLVRRWKANVERAERMADGMRSSLQAMARRLGTTPVDADAEGGGGG